MTDEGNVWPDALEVGDSVDFDGHTYDVISTGPGKATLERVDDERYQIDVFRWAFTDAVGMEIKVDFDQEQFGKMVSKE